MIPTVQPSSLPTSAPVANIYLTKGVLFYLGKPIYSNDASITKAMELLGSSYILFGRNFRHKGEFPFVLSLESETSKNFVSLLNHDNSGITSDTVTRSTTVLGDINNDGFLDLMIGLPLESKSLVFLGNSFGVDDTESFAIIGDPEQAGGQLGWSSTRVGDLNHDGFDEIAVSAPYANIVYFIYGRAKFNEDIIIINLTPKDGFKIIASQEDADLGVAIALVHDFNKDGYQDIAITAVRPEGENVIYVLLGNSLFGKEDIQIDELIKNNRSSCFRIIAPFLSYAGYSIAGIGDINNDGYNDLAIGSIPINNAEYVEQRTYIIYGRESIENDFALAEMSKKDGFIIVGGGFLIEATSDVNGDGMNDVMITNYYGWKNQGNAYLIHYPKNVSYSPTFQPSSSPSNLPTSVPSVTPSTSKPSYSPSLTQLTFFPSSLNISVPFNPVSDVTQSFFITQRPSIVPTFHSSYSSIPSTFPTIASTRKPSPAPTVIRVNPSVKPFFSRSPTAESHLRTRNPTSAPTSETTRNISGYTNVYCSKANDYKGKNATNYRFFITVNTGTLKITGQHEGEAKNLYVLYCPSDPVNVVITNFRLSTDMISVDHLSEAGYYYPTLNDIPFALNRGPLTLRFCSQNKLQVILSSHTSFDVTDKNFILRQVVESDSTQTPSSSNISNVQIAIVAVVGLMVALNSFAAYLNQDDEKDGLKQLYKPNESHFESDSDVSDDDEEQCRDPPPSARSTGFMDRSFSVMKNDGIHGFLNMSFLDLALSPSKRSLNVNYPSAPSELRDSLGTSLDSSAGYSLGSSTVCIDEKKKGGGRMSSLCSAPISSATDENQTLVLSSLSTSSSMLISSISSATRLSTGNQRLADEDKSTLEMSDLIEDVIPAPRIAEKIKETSKDSNYRHNDASESLSSDVQSFSTGTLEDEIDSVLDVFNVVDPEEEEELSFVFTESEVELSFVFTESD
jgi:hypothetical protein